MLQVLIEDRQREDVYLDVNPLFSQGAYKEKLVQFFKQFMFNWRREVQDSKRSQTQLGMRTEGDSDITVHFLTIVWIIY